MSKKGKKKIMLSNLIWFIFGILFGIIITIVIVMDDNY